MKTNGHISSKKIGLVLGSGSARGWAHIGVIQALAEAGIRVDGHGRNTGSLIDQRMFNPIFAKNLLKYAFFGQNLTFTDFKTHQI